MRKVLAVIRREFVERIRTKMFWVSAILGPVFFAALIFIPVLMAGRGGTKHIAIVDDTGTEFGARVEAALSMGKTFRVERVAGGGRVVDSLVAEVTAKRLDGFLLLSDSLVRTGKAEYQASNVSSLGAIGELQGVLRQQTVNSRLEAQGVDPRLVAQASAIRITLETKKISGGKTTSESSGQSFSLAYFMGLILYISIILYGVNVMGSVLEEKTNKIVEVLISSLRPFQLLVGKLLGVGAVSLFQFLIWGVSARLMMSQRMKLMSGMGGSGDAGQVFQVPTVTGPTAAIFLAYFLGGFFLYSAMFATVGAISSNEQEARQTQVPVTLMLVVAFMSMFAMLNDPGSTYSVVLSLIPFTSPIAMPVRWAAGSLPITEVAASLAILVATIVGVIWVAARIYRVGILMTGKRPSLREIARWVRTA